MNHRSSATGYALAALIGAVAGGFIVARTTKALPNMMSEVMFRMRQKMLEHMKESGINPAEM